ncbi:hypothetical protein [Bradyrhizobium uaiense]|uniref:hypothetical protein n=1 Tax=Bradyrhizobium uaiense TaxID=2594946 RepID=UPI0013D71B91|nr:hypothetical protein [Bradyrhizobium uaiense]
MLTLDGERIAERGEGRSMMRIEAEHPVQQHRALRGAIGHEGDDGGQMQRRDMVWMGSQNIAAQRAGLRRAARAIMRHRIQQHPINRRTAHDRAPASQTPMGIKRAAPPNPARKSRLKNPDARRDLFPFPLKGGRSGWGSATGDAVCGESKSPPALLLRAKRPPFQGEVRGWPETMMPIASLDASPIM